MNTLKKWLWVVLASATLVACSGGGDSGGGSGEPESATVDSNNKNDMAKASSLGANAAVDSQAAPGAKTYVGSSEPGILGLLNTTFAPFNPESRDLNSRAETDVPGLCSSGSATYDTSGFNQSGHGTVTVTYNSCTYAYGTNSVTVDGTASWTISSDNGFSYDYNITITRNGTTTTVTGTYSCDSNFNCTYSDSFSSGGVNYEISNVSISGSVGSGYDLSFRVVHEDYGYIDVQGSDLVQCDSGSGFASGTITVTDSSGSSALTVSFVSCSEMTVTFEGSSETVDQ